MWEVGCQHGDISVYNLMYRKNDDKITGVLNDWDLATSCDARGPFTEKGKRTGTLPFAALELVQHRNKPYTRRQRHDIESFGWCLVYICLRSPDNHQFLRTWHDIETSVSSRTRFLVDAPDYEPRTGFELLYASATAFIGWYMRKVVDIFRDPQDSSPRQEPDDREIWKGVLGFLGGVFHKNL